MTKRNIIGFFAVIVLISLNILGCNSRKNRYESPGKLKTEKNDTIPVIKEKTAVLEKLTFFIENSGSMFGYVNQANEFKNSLVGLAYLPEFDKAVKSFYFINGTSNPVKNSGIKINYLGNDPEIFKNQLNQKSFNIGEVKFSDLNRMFEIALDSAKENQISALVSDCVYDVGDDKDPLTSLRIEINKTQQSFRNRLEKEDIQTLIIKAGSRFDGLYYYASKKGSQRITNEERPFYIIFFGKTQLLNKSLTEQSIGSKIEGRFETARFYVNDEKSIPYQIVPSIDIKGEIWGYKKWAFFFVVIGMNAIAVYVATHLFDFSKIGNVFVGGLSKYLGSWNEFVQALAALTVIWLILYWMYLKKTFIKI